MRRPNINVKKILQNLHREDCSEKNDKRKRDIKTRRRLWPGAGARSRVSSSSRWSRRLHDGGVQTQHTHTHTAHTSAQTHTHATTTGCGQRYFTNAHVYAQTHACIQTHTHTYETTPTLPIKRRPVSLVTLSAASECLPLCYRGRAVTAIYARTRLRLHRRRQHAARIRARRPTATATCARTTDRRVILIILIKLSTTVVQRDIHPMHKKNVYCSSTKNELISNIQIHLYW